ncbi:hypothetical protein PENSOL_c009G07929 [Penicillium solitum]|uniref:Uncharacterized protein n=1 Tax=Penicillium solitum TaxID=60172 RepID=A0A1V6RAV2_9EURO|nr:uncharacterized protein PENSOL_c009G07929 [Penicillium solitum]OQD98391.1 hypothetical protein PENSOL_c009G07929 [Penicillium solitum]
MAWNSSCQPVLSCEDSPLAITGSLIGIITLAYAIIITVLYRTQELGNANEDIKRIGGQIRREYISLDSLHKWIRDLHGTTEMSHEIYYLAEALVKEARKTEIQKDLDDILRIRSSLEAICQELANRVMLHKVQKQSEMFEGYRASLKNQKAMLRRVMDALHLDAMDESTDENSVSSSSSSKLELDEIDIEMRQPTQWDPPGQRNDDT